MRKLLVTALIASLIASACGCADGMDDMAHGTTVAAETTPAVTTALPATSDPVLELETADWKQRTVGDFNADFAPLREGYSGYGPNEPKAEFLQSLFFSAMEVDGALFGEVPTYSASTAADVVKAQVDYILSWQIPDPFTITIGERNAVLNEAINQMVNLVNSKSGGTFDQPGSLEALNAELETIIASLADDKITPSIVIEAVTAVN